MLFSEMGSAARKILLCGSVASAILLPYHAATAAPGSSSDTSAPMRANAAAYPEFFAPNRDSDPDRATERVRQCKKPLGIAATDSRCTRS